MIGVTCNFDYRDAVGMVSGMGITGQDWDFVSGDYVYILEKAGAIPVLIPQYGDLEAAKPFLEQLDGVLISGGHDVGPERYGAFPKGYCGTIMPMRDEQDIAISRYFMMEKKKPILGICRGIQIMNVACGAISGFCPVSFSDSWESGLRLICHRHRWLYRNNLQDRVGFV